MPQLSNSLNEISRILFIDTVNNKTARPIHIKLKAFWTGGETWIPMIRGACSLDYFFFCHIPNICLLDSRLRYWVHTIILKAVIFFSPLEFQIELHMLIFTLNKTMYIHF